LLIAVVRRIGSIRIVAPAGPTVVVQRAVDVTATVARRFRAEMTNRAETLQVGPSGPGDGGRIGKNTCCRRLIEIEITPDTGRGAAALQIGLREGRREENRRRRGKPEDLRPHHCHFAAHSAPKTKGIPFAIK
jgi:hypothetical protein